MFWKELQGLLPGNHALPDDPAPSGGGTVLLCATTAGRGTAIGGRRASPPPWSREVGVQRRS